MRSVKKWCLAFAVVGSFTLGVTAPAFAANPPGTGRPDQTCQLVGPGGDTGPQYPGNTSTSPGSVFHETPPGGTGGNQYNAVGAPSQYDVACFQQVSNHL